MWPEWLLHDERVRPQERLARHSQFGVGGPADLFMKIDDVEALPELIARCHADSVPITVLGAGSNALIRDEGIAGLTVRITARELHADGDVATLDAGTMMPRAALDLAQLGMSGLEWGIGVPGTCGASVWGNAGAFGGEVASALVDCLVCDPSGRTRWMAATDCGFGYRDSRFKGDLTGSVILRARFAIRPESATTVRERTAAVQAERKATQPYGVRSLGSTFKNPAGGFAGRLIEEAGLKGRRRGGAQISPKHANFILNVASATAADVLALVAVAHDEVMAASGIDLAPEIVVVGRGADRAVAAGSGA